MSDDKEEIRLSLHRAVYGGNLSKVRDVVNRHGLHYSRDWSAGYIFLRHAIEWGYTEIAKFLLQKGAKVNSLNCLVDTPLHFAVLEGYVELVEMLIDRNARIDAQNGFSETPLLVATKKCNEEMVKLLLSRGANCCLADTSGTEPLHIACEKQLGDIFKLLLGYRVQQAGSSQSLHKALCLASSHGNEEMVSTLLIAGADPNPVTELCVPSAEKCTGAKKLSSSPLFSACQRGHTEVVNLLFTHGGQVNCSYPANKSDWWLGCQAHTSCTPLHGASENGHLDIVCCLLSNGADTRAEAEGKVTSLHLAAIKGHTEIVELLLKNAADVNAETEEGLTPLLLSVKHGHTEVSKVLLEAGSCVNSKNGEDESPLCLAVEKKNSLLVSLILQFKPDIDEKIHQSVIRALKYGSGCKKMIDDLMDYGLILSREVVNDTRLLPAAVQEGCAKVVECLLNYGVDPTSVEYGSSLLHSAVIWGHEKIVALLLKSGCSVNAIDQKGKTPIDYLMDRVVNDEFAGIVRLLCAHGANVKETPELLPKAVYWECFEICRILIKNGADVNALDAEGCTPLYIIASKSHRSLPLREHDKIDIAVREKIIKLLINNGADVNFRTNDGFSVLHQALVNGRIDAIRALLDCGADVDSRDKDGFSLLYVASHFGSKRSVEAFCNKKATIDARQRDDSTALHGACKKGHKDIVKILCRNGASVDARNVSGSTPLHCAAMGGHAEIIKILLDYNADIDAQTVTNLTAFHFAVWHKQCKAATVLLERGCDINKEDSRGKTALNFINKTGKSFLNLSYSDRRNFCDRRNQMTEILKNHSIKLKVAGMYINKKILCLLELKDEFLNFQRECEEEVRRLKSRKIHDSCHLTLHHILVSCGNPTYARNELLLQTLNSCDYQEFPLYRSLIMNSVQKCKPRIELLSSGQESLSILLKTSNVFREDKLPILLPELLEEIVSYLNKIELQNLITCVKAIKTQLSKS